MARAEVEDIRRAAEAEASTMMAQRREASEQEARTVLAAAHAEAEAIRSDALKAAAELEQNARRREQAIERARPLHGRARRLGPAFADRGVLPRGGVHRSPARRVAVAASRVRVRGAAAGRAVHSARCTHGRRGPRSQARAREEPEAEEEADEEPEPEDAAEPEPEDEPEPEEETEPEDEDVRTSLRPKPSSTSRRMPKSRGGRGGHGSPKTRPSPRSEEPRTPEDDRLVRAGPAQPLSPAREALTWTPRT